MEGKEKRGVIVQSVARALTMISCFANDTELGISEIAERDGSIQEYDIRTGQYIDGFWILGTDREQKIPPGSQAF